MTLPRLRYKPVDAFKSRSEVNAHDLFQHGQCAHRVAGEAVRVESQEIDTDTSDTPSLVIEDCLH